VARYEAEGRAPAAGEAQAAPPMTRSGASVRTVLGIAGLGLGALGVGGGVALAAASRGVAADRPAGESQVDAVDRNERIHTLNTWSTVAYVTGGVAAAVGLVLLLWPDADKRVKVSSGRRGASLSYEAAF
jgi:hypothetical protein